jgi:hypothetical protein
VSYSKTPFVVRHSSLIVHDLSIFLYLFLLACFAGTVYFFYTVWIAPYFPQKRKGGKAPEFSKKASGASKKAEEGPSSPAVSSATTYNAEWIPAHHINRPEARKVKGSSRSKSRA